MTEPANDLVLRSDVDGLTTLTLNRPDKLNALSPASFIALREHIDAIAVDDSVGCVVLTGAGRAFCAGHDLVFFSIPYHHVQMMNFPTLIGTSAL